MTKKFITFALLLFSQFAFSQNTQQENLTTAIVNNDHQAIQSILENSPLLLDSSFTQSKLIGSYKTYPLHLAIKDAEASTIRLLIDKGADSEVKSYSSSILSGTYISTLQMLIRRGSLEVLEAFYDDIYKDPEGYTKALLEASENGNNDMVRFLLERGEGVLLTQEQVESGK